MEKLEKEKKQEKAQGIEEYNLASGRAEAKMGENPELQKAWIRVWERIEERQGETFYTKKGLPFQYRIKGGEMFVDRRSKSITKSTLEKAFFKLESDPERIKGPKALNVFGAPYVWSILQEIKAGLGESEK